MVGRVAGDLGEVRHRACRIRPGHGGSSRVVFLPCQPEDRGVGLALRGDSMRTLVLLILLVPMVGCSNLGGARRSSTVTTNPASSGSVPISRKPPSISQRKMLHNLQNPPEILGRSKVEGALVR